MKSSIFSLWAKPSFSSGSLFSTLYPFPSRQSRTKEHNAPSRFFWSLLQPTFRNVVTRIIDAGIKSTNLILSTSNFLFKSLHSAAYRYWFPCYFQLLLPRKASKTALNLPMIVEHFPNTRSDLLSVFCVKQQRGYNIEIHTKSNCVLVSRLPPINLHSPHSHDSYWCSHDATLWKSQFCPYSRTFPHTLVVTRRLIFVILTTVLGTSYNGNTYGMKDSSQCFHFCPPQLVASGRCLNVQENIKSHWEILHALALMHR